MPANPGDPFTYQPSHGNGYGHNASGAPLTAEMTELDLKPGTPVTFLEYDADSGWPIIEWIDDTGIGRLTTIEPGTFNSDFTPA